MIIGFTGTREDITEAQKAWLTNTFDALQIDQLHHGACTGADAFAHDLAVERNIPVVVHPPIKTNFLAAQCLIPRPNVVVLPAKPYLNRNKDIVGCSNGMIALPKNHEPQNNMEPSGGTWYTVRFAQERANKPVMICYPDGEVEKREARRVG